MAITLNSNAVIAALSNQIIRQIVNGDNIANKSVTKFCDEATREGGLYGDSILVYDSDTLKTRAFDPNDLNILQPEKTPDIKEQRFVIDNFRTIGAYIPTNFLFKQAWESEGSYGEIVGVIKATLMDTKDIYRGTTYNVFIGTTKPEKTTQVKEITLTPGQEGAEIATEISNIMDDLSDPTREYNDYGFKRSYNYKDMKVIISSEWLNKVKKIELPGVFHDEELKNTFSNDNKLLSKYLGNMNDATVLKADGTTIRAAEEVEINGEDYMPGDLLPKDTVLVASNAIKIKSYKQDSDIIGLMFIKGKMPPYFSALSVATSFYNPKNLSENNWLHFGSNTLNYLKGAPFIVIKKKTA